MKDYPSNIISSFLWQSRLDVSKSLEEKLKDRKNLCEGRSTNIADACDLIAGRIVLARRPDIKTVEEILKVTLIFRNPSQPSKPVRQVDHWQVRFRNYDGLYFCAKMATRLSRALSFLTLVIETHIFMSIMKRR